MFAQLRRQAAEVSAAVAETRGTLPVIAVAALAVTLVALVALALASTALVRTAHV